ncbi:unnamed protein product, partial [Litomosoides sigmodontis]
VDHLLQVIQWALGICSLGLALVVLDGVETEEDDFSVAAHNPAVEDEGFFGRSMRELLHSPEISELLITERNPTTDRSSCSIYDNYIISKLVMLLVLKRCSSLDYFAEN